MAAVNKVILVGNLTKDPEVKYSQSGSPICNFSIATNDTWKDKNTGEKREKVEFHRIVVFGKLAEICGEYLSKGRQVYIEGRLQTRSWEKDGITRYSTEVVIDQRGTMQMLGARNDHGNSGGYQQGQSQVPSGCGSQGGYPDDDDGDDIPFS